MRRSLGLRLETASIAQRFIAADTPVDVVDTARSDVRMTSALAGGGSTSLWGAVMGAPTLVSLYTGAGGLDLGFAMAGFRPVFSNDIDRDAVATYTAAIHAAAGELTHLKEGRHRITSGDIRSVDDLPGEGAADLVIGGPPCQGFSVAGRMDPNDPRSRHVWDFMGMVKRVRPRAFVMENVKALAMNRRWTSLIDDLKETAESPELGYKTSLFVLRASDYGVPQARERMFFIGARPTDAGVDAPPPTTKDCPPTLRSALETLPGWGEPGNDTLCTAKVTPAKIPVMRRSPFAGMVFNGQGRPMNLDAPAPTLPASMGGNRTPIIDQNQLENGGDSWVIKYHADLWRGKPPVTVVPKRMRRITVEEAAAIQTFPPLMPWSGRQSSQYRQIGNAVPPLLAYAVASHLRRHLGYRDFDPPARVLGLAVPR